MIHISIGFFFLVVFLSYLIVWVTHLLDVGTVDYDAVQRSYKLHPDYDNDDEV